MYILSLGRCVLSQIFFFIQEKNFLIISLCLQYSHYGSIQYVVIIVILILCHLKLEQHT